MASAGPSAGAAGLAEALLARYVEGHRRYHTVEHLAEVLGWVDELAGQADDLAAVELAAWYHDAVYDPTGSAGDSERRSASLAHEELSGLGLPRAVVEEVERLVLLTAGHEVADGDRNGAVLADADLAILGASPARYARYVADVRAEYIHVPARDWVVGRAAVLTRFVRRDRIFHTEVAHLRLDRSARRNLTQELQSLNQSA